MLTKYKKISLPILFATFFALFFGVIVFVATAADQLKTVDSLVLTSNTSISALTNAPFTLYIGDNLSGITNPIKSLSFPVSGVYTGGGSLTLAINGDTATAQTFALPTVTVPTSFEFIYKDPSNKINPTSAGSYSYTLNITPSGVTVYGFAVKLSETHQYKPPACGGYPVSGDLTSVIFDSTGSADGAGYNSLLWKGTMGGGQGPGKVRFQFAASASVTGPWNFIGGSTCGSGDWFDPGAPDTAIEILGATCLSQFNNMRYFRYKVQVCSLDCISAGNSTPTITDIIVNWAP